MRTNVMNRVWCRLAAALLVTSMSAGAAIAQEKPVASPPAGDVKIITCGTLLAVPGKPPLKNATIVVRNGVIESVTEGQPPMSRRQGDVVERIDLSDKYVLPGLIDCHVHLTGIFNETYLQRRTTETPEFATARATAWAKLTLEAGFTTVRDLGGSAGAILGLRDAINQGYVVGPRVIAAGKSIAVTGGHADPTNLLRQDLVLPVDERDGVADGADACAKAVRYQIKLGADCIKLTATGGVLSASTAGLKQHFTEAELASLVNVAHMMNRKVAAHAHGVDGINAALRAGVDSIEHGTYLDDESIKLFKEKGAYLVPTMLAAVTVGENAAKPGYYLRIIAEKAATVAPINKSAVQKAHGAGVKMAFGTDTGVSEHGQNAREFALLVDAGIPPMEAITMATVAAADLLGLSAEIGTLEKGKKADLIAVVGDPAADVKVLEKVGFVMKEGKVVKGK